MTWRLTERKKHTEATTTFLFFSRYCGKCMVGFWLERVPFVEQEDGWGPEPRCPNCSSFLWSSEENAIRYRK